MQINERLKVSLRDAIISNIQSIPNLGYVEVILSGANSIVFMFRVYAKRFYDFEIQDEVVNYCNFRRVFKSLILSIPEFAKPELLDCIAIGESIVQDINTPMDDAIAEMKDSMCEFNHNKGYGSIVNIIAYCNRFNPPKEVTSVFNKILYGDSREMMAAFRSDIFVGFLKDNFGKTATRWLRDVEPIFAYELLGDSTTVAPKAFSTLASLGNKD